MFLLLTKFHRWTCLLKQQMSITVYLCRPSTINFCFPFAENQRKFAVSVFCLQQINGSCRFQSVLFSIYIYWNGSISIDIYISLYMYVDLCKCIYSIYLFLYIYAAVSNRKRKTKAQAILLYPLTVCSSFKRMFVICLFVYEETKESYLCKWTKRTCSSMQSLYITKFIITKFISLSIKVYNKEVYPW
jgi:hypothetical protein